MSKESLIEEYIKLAKRANKRLSRLENLSKNPTYKNIKHWAYRTAMYSIKNMGEDRRFPTSIKKLDKKSIEEISKMRNKVYDFLSQETSTKKGIDKFYIKRVKTLNEKYNINLNWWEVADFFESGGIMDKMTKAGFSSKTAIRIIGVFQKNGKDIKKIIDEYNKNHKITDSISKEIDSLKGNKFGDNEEAQSRIINKMSLSKIAKLLEEDGVLFEGFFE